MQLIFNLGLALKAIRTNMLRSVLTIFIIAIGIMALVGILTSTDVLQSALVSNFSDMGANSFQITGNVFSAKSKRRGFSMQISEGKSIDWQEAQIFKSKYSVPAKIGLSMQGSGVATISYGFKKTNPNVAIMGVDEQYFPISNTSISEGRLFSPYEVQTGTNVCILGNGIAEKLFKGTKGSVIGAVVSSGNAKYSVVGVAASKGGNMLMNSDNTCYIPIATAKNLYGSKGIAITVAVDNIKTKDIATEEAEGLFRAIRRIPIGKANNFSVQQNDAMIANLMEDMKFVTMAAFIIGTITLLCSVVGLMNIMLVSVAERTREIGINKALGAKPSTIRGQFLTESILISIIGGILGVILGIAAGNGVAIAMETAFILPIGWMIMGVSICAVVGIISGIYPAIKASRMDPIVALRHD